MNRLKEIRMAESASHTEAYTNYELYSAGSWLAKPVKTVLDLLPMFEGYSEFRALDLGSGVGRNSIPVAQYFKDIPCRVDCVDILELAIEKLNENAVRFGVKDRIHGIVSPIDTFEVKENSYDLILAVSALEHVDCRETFVRKLQEVQRGIRFGGIVCLIVNTGVRERDKATGETLLPQFEVNLETEEIHRILERAFAGCRPLKRTVLHQKYDIPRENGKAELETDVVTFVVRKVE